MSPSNYRHQKKDPSNDFFDHRLVGYKQPISSHENARTNDPAAILEGYQKNLLRIGISWIIAAQNMVLLNNSGQFEDFAGMVTDE